jgi:hypothetical protein
VHRGGINPETVANFFAYAPPLLRLLVNRLLAQMRRGDKFFDPFPASGRALWHETARMSEFGSKHGILREKRNDEISIRNRRLFDYGGCGRGFHVSHGAWPSQPKGDRKRCGSIRISCTRRDASACRIVAVASPTVCNILSRRPEPSTTRLPAHSM